MKERPPFLLHLVCLCFLLAAAVQVFGIILAVRTWNWLHLTGYQPFPAALEFKNAFFALAFFASALVLWIRCSWATGFGSVVIVLSSTWFWIDRLVLTSNPQPFKEHVFLLLVSILLLSLALASLYLLTPYMRYPVPPPGEENDQSPA